MKQTIGNSNPIPIEEKNLTDDFQLFLENNKENVYELMNLVKQLQEYNLLTLVNHSMTKHSNRLTELNRKDIHQLINGIKKGIEEGSANIDTRKDINAFQLMKYIKDPDINRAVNFLVHFLRGMGRSMK
ncbi:DUF1641 domain-containing protein [Bacillus sp. FJAT-49736]|uniref:DUF1641 domain-containing protein n=1 Tax=Bacillus sp. FJAT-49736 TaxID=2833582 RepID=UPI001BC91CDF|nr:DUF1641 domain-containing protein [Bacillus sp. FJAT-49736]MBS4172991.1 DUF1641 domain-containing protein [Bacillus sp. FJAT-49736]